MSLGRKINLFWAPANLQFKGFGRIHLAHFSAFRLLLEEDGTDGLRFKTDPIALFEEKKTELSSTIQNTFESQGRVVQQVGKATDAWIRLEGQLQMEMLIRERIKAA